MSVSVTGQRVSVGVNKMLVLLNSLYNKKVSSDRTISSEEQLVLSRIENSLLLRAFVDPSVEFKRTKGYVPPRLELELVYAAVRGRMPESAVTNEGLLMFAFDRLGVLGGFEAEN